MVIPRPFIQLMTSSILLILGSQPGHAQRESPPGPELSGGVTLSSDAEVRRHYNQLQQKLRQQSSDELAALYDGYRAALAAASEENAKLYGMLQAENRASHAALRSESLDTATRSRRTQEIQDAYASATAERRATYTSSQRALADRYESDRADRRALLDRELSIVDEQMSASLARLRAGASSVTVPATVSTGRLDGIGAAVGIVTPNC